MSDQEVPQVPVPVDDGPKVFVGNLSFKTKDEDLVAFFEKVGKVTHAKVITISRKTSSRRSAGYGFVTFATLEDASKAAEELDKKELEGREINVELARPPKKQAPKEVQPENQVVENGDDKDDAAAKKKTRKPRARRQRKKSQAKAEEKKEGAEEEDAVVPDESANDVTADEQDDTDDKKSKRGRGRRISKRVLGEPSKTTLFVTNLAYAATDDVLKNTFKEYKVQSTYVARNKNGRSRGYGFVEFESEDDQVKALEVLQNTEIEGRQVHLKVARSERHTPLVTDDAADAQENGHVEAADAVKA
ncbi:RNA-binding domain-containing protein [Hesseltinella vesiculosa]|uniref:RNA-binding domain-containing protein n=1 Tax=Hesseltinella vesiculosa TaxID=101127 RepID=A0A1X2GTX3_9FUNG|nr:RNA-binding domain-containing protein [Hesseltinella vesiculosa]